MLPFEIVSLPHDLEEGGPWGLLSESVDASVGNVTMGGSQGWATLKGGGSPMLVGGETGGIDEGVGEGVIATALTFGWLDGTDGRDARPVSATRFGGGRLKRG